MAKKEYDLSIMKAKLDPPKIELTLQAAFKVCADNNYAVVACDYINKLYDEISDLRTMLDIMKDNVVLVKKIDNGKEVNSLEIKPNCKNIDEQEYKLYKEWLENERVRNT